MKQALFLPLVIFFSPSLLAQVNLNQGLLAYYPYSGNANEASGNNNNAVFNNATLAADRFDNANSAYSFNGIDNYIRIPNSASLNSTNQISLCVWVKVAGFYQGKCHGNNILTKGDADYLTGNYHLRFDDVNAYGGCLSCSLQSDFSIQQNPCDPLSISFLASSPSYNSVEWDFGDGNMITGPLGPTHIYNSYGNYTVRMVLTHDANCNDTVTKTISVNIQNDNQLILTQDTTICFGATKKIQTKPALSFCWSPTSYLDDPNSPNPITSTPQNITYYYTAAAVGSNLITNGDFSTGNAGFTSGYHYANPNVTEGEYFVGTSPQAWNSALSNCGDHTSGTGKMMLVNGSPVPDVTVVDRNGGDHTQYQLCVFNLDTGSLAPQSRTASIFN